VLLLLLLLLFLLFVTSADEFKLPVLNVHVCLLFVAVYCCPLFGVVAVVAVVVLVVCYFCR